MKSSTSHEKGTNSNKEHNKHNEMKRFPIAILAQDVFVCVRLFFTPTIHTHTHTRTHLRAHAHTHACMHARKHAHMHTHTHTHAHMHTHTHTHTNARTHSRTHTCTPRTHTPTIHTHTHTHTQNRPCVIFISKNMKSD